LVFSYDFHFLYCVDTGIWTKVTNTTNCPPARYFAAGDCLDPIKGVFVFIGGCSKSDDDMYYLFTGSTKCLIFASSIKFLKAIRLWQFLCITE